MKAQMVGAASLNLGLLGTTYYAQPVTIDLITNGNSKSLFVMKTPGTKFITRYDYQADQLRVSLESGEVEMNYLAMEVKVSALSASLSTEKLQLAISDNMPITVKSGSKLTTNNGLKFLPGASLTVEEGAELEISNGSNAALYFYGEGDYKKEWSNNRYRRRVEASGIVNKSNQTVVPTGDAQLNLAGTLTVNGVLSFSTNHRSGLTAVGPNAKVVVNKLPTTAQKAIKEAYLTGDSGEVQTSSAWQAPSGPMVNDGTVTAFAEGATYTAVPAGEGAYNWTRYTLNINYVDAAGKAVSDPTPEKLYSVDGTVSFQAPEGYAITNIQANSNSSLTVENTTTVDNGKTKLANAVTDGCTDVKLSNITADGTITVTVKKYDHTVRWNFADAKSKDVTHTFMSYLASDETQAVRAGIKGGVVDATGAVTIQTTEGAAFEGAGSSINTGKDPFEVTVTGINKDAVATVLYSASRSVTWKVTVDGSEITVPKTEIKNGSEATYELKQDGERWQVVETSDITCTDSVVTVKDRANTDDITVTGVYGDVTVNIAITTYAHKVITNVITLNGQEKTTVAETKYTNDAEWTYTVPSKSVIAKYSVTGGTAKGAAALYETKRDIAAIADSFAVVLSGKTVTVDLSVQTYYACVTWNAVNVNEESKPAVAELSYREYITTQSMTGKVIGWNGAEYDEPGYRTLRSNGTEGFYYFDPEWDENLTYTVPDETKYAIIPDGYRDTVKSKSVYLEPDCSQGIITKIKDCAVTVELMPYLYNVVVQDAADNSRLALLCIGSNDLNVLTGKPAAYTGWDVSGGKQKYFAVGYQILTGSAEVNGHEGTNVTGLAVLGKSSSTGLVLSDIQSDTTIAVTFEPYAAYLEWTLKGLGETAISYIEFMKSDLTGVVDAASGQKPSTWKTAKEVFGEGNGYVATIAAPEGFYVRDVDNPNWDDYIDSDRRSAHTQSLWVGQTFTVNYAPYHCALTWSVDGGEKQYMYINNTDSSLNYNAANYNAGTWTYYPADGKLIKSFTSSSCAVHLAADKLSLAVTNLQPDSTVSIVTQAPTTALEGYYMGDMSFEWVRNAAVYTFDADGTTASWKPVDSFVWRHAAGSKSFTVTDDGDAITVANGSIYFINSTSKAKTYTIKLERTDSATNSALKLMVDGEVFEAAGDTVIIPAHTSQTVVCTLSGTPTADELQSGEIGHIAVTENNG